jgi:hypothetical protein
MFGLVLPVARHARSLEEGLNVLGKSQVLLIGGRGQFADIDSADVPLVVLRQSRQSDHGHSKQYRCGGSVHIVRELVIFQPEKASKIFLRFLWTALRLRFSQAIPQLSQDFIRRVELASGHPLPDKLFQ